MKNLIKDLSSSNWDKALKASDELSKDHSEDIFDQLIVVLNNAETSDTVNAVALALREIKNNKAVYFLIKSLDNPINIDNKSTIVYALENLDCSEYFLKIFTLFITSKSFDVQLSAYTILTEQNFIFRDFELSEANIILNRCNLSLEDLEVATKIIEGFSRSHVARGNAYSNPNYQKHSTSKYRVKS